MDFNQNEEQAAVKELADRIFEDCSTNDRLKVVEQGAGPEGPFDVELWKELATAGLLGIGLPEDVGGAGLDFVALGFVIEAAGRTAAHVPIVETLVHGAATIDRFGTSEQRHHWLPRVVTGELILSAAFAELIGETVVSAGLEPATTAIRLATGRWRLDGVKACVPAGMHAGAVLVPAALGSGSDSSPGLGIFIVETTLPGIVRTPQDGPAEPDALLELSGVEVGPECLLGGEELDAASAVTSMTEFATAALCVEEAGVCAGAMALVAEYTKTREQFGKPIATFQAVGQRAADAYVDTEAVRLTAFQAVWRLAEGLPAAAEVAVAKFWAADGGQRVVHAAMHLHGGVGVDRDYPLHRYFLRTRQIELSLGGAHASLQRLGALLAAAP